ncbi:site-specific DNA-methyltransferase (cytosine-N4-specific) [Streptomyces sp. LaPpAH-199]|uniref:DNA-methyltransferase n=1 Tax=Streptomyces TaxID=1883 RepID=UPI0008832D9A|nr:site-specific DNA-methyltransferase [Streptomyces sp. LaPpAH-199]MYW82121.1 site-specific DNA-methyltransferase [Streptomyces sp. SID8369]SDC27926.1 site-specific DNA-methyltransferase (cytosine-N4-specific) [Streptomyces sp. LaPpAH-199]
MQDVLDRLRSGRVCYTTPRGAQLTGDSLELLGELPANSVDLFMTSPPFPLLRKKAYGNEDQEDYVNWLVKFAKLAKDALKPTGSLVIDIGGAYQQGVPVRSLHQFRALLAFVDDLGYFLAEEFYWYNRSKLPSPIEWVNKRKWRAKDAVNTVWWLSKTEQPKADVGRVRVPYSKSMQQLLKDPAAYYRPKERPSEHNIGKAFGVDNGGALPSNLLDIPNSQSNDAYLRTLKAMDVKGHPARFPLKLPAFFIEMLTEPGDLVVDFFGGSNTTGRVAENLDRDWLSFELDPAYAALSAVRFMEGQKPENIRLAVEQIEAGATLELRDGLGQMSEPTEADIKVKPADASTQLRIDAG